MEDRTVDAKNIVQRVLHRDSSTLIRARGLEYLRQGRVSLLHCNSQGAEAMVKGTTRYHVRLWLHGQSLAFECSCPFAENGALCKHVWAVALDLDHDEMARSFRQALAEAMTSAGPGDAVPSAVPPELVAETVLATQGLAASADHERSRWQRLLGTAPTPHQLPDASSEDWYLIDPLLSASGAQRSKVLLHTARRTVLKRGGLGHPTGFRRPPGGERPEGLAGVVWDLARSRHDGTAELGRELCRQVLPELAQRRRLGAYDPRRGELLTLAWAGGPPWKVVLDVVTSDESGLLRIEGTLERESGSGREVCPLSRATPLGADLLLVGDQLYELEPGHDDWLRELLSKPLDIARASLEKIARELVSRPRAPRFRDLTAIGWSPLRVTPRPRLRLLLPKNKARVIRGRLTFAYGEEQHLGWAAREITLEGRLVERDVEGEALHLSRLAALGVQLAYGPHDEGYPFVVSFDIDKLPELVDAVTEEGFLVEVEGKPYRRLRAFQPIVESEQDWFDLRGDVEFEGELLTMPELLRAVRARDRWVRLGDGGLGLLPDAWLDSLETLAALVPPRASRLRLHASQASWLEQLLTPLGHLRTDPAFERMKARLQRFDGVMPIEPPAGFRGELREYQALALGWLAALDELGFGGCLADDMGLGKTVVVLAWLLSRSDAQQQGGRTRRRTASPHTPSLVVVPKSLLFNWFRESERFTPTLRVLIHHGNDRRPPGPHFHDFDVVLTSYGTLRRDVEALQAIEFDAVVLDEAHGIKNAWTHAHQAACALSARRRLGLTGTPVENHLGELWSLMSFLNPELFAGLGHLKKAFEHRRPSRTALEDVILKSVKPFILRRTKAQVAKDLPERVEKTLHVALSKEERRLYDELAAFFKRRILERRMIRRRTQGKSKNGRETAEALEALLRLRQAACHPGLLDDSRRNESSSKLEVLLEQLEQVRAGGHKALVFSQFTKLLGLLIPRLEANGIAYAYLDGKTQHRQAVVDGFQEDPHQTVFLISLKAGGVGLNLVAADYVYLLDPWWNPASEAQAIDRAHRIGQTRTVIAYRLLSTGTVEEKVAALQNEKRELAAALFGDEKNFAAKFTREDLEALLD